jgi:hypothetical protein
MVLPPISSVINEMLDSRVLSLNGLATLGTCWSSWYHRIQSRVLSRCSLRKCCLSGDRLPWEHAEAVDITTGRADCQRDARFENVVSQRTSYPGSMLEQLITPYTELVATEMLTSKGVSLKGSTTPTMYWSGWYDHQQSLLAIEIPTRARGLLAPRVYGSTSKAACSFTHWYSLYNSYQIKIQPSSFRNLP